MLPWERLKPLIGVAVAGVAALTWVLVFRTGWSSSNDWNQEWNNPTDTRGKSVYIANREVETTAEREKRLTKLKLLNGEIGAAKKSVLGDRRTIRGNDIIPEQAPVPEGFEYNPREACLQMKMEYPERYGKVDCMSDRYDSGGNWWEVGRHGH